MDPFTGSIGSALASMPPVGASPTDTHLPGPSAQPAEPGGNFGSYLDAMPEAGRVPIAIQPSMPPTTPIQQLSQPPQNTLGNDVLNSLERYGSRVQTLQKVGSDAGKHGAGTHGVSGGLGGPASNHIAPSGGAPDAMADIRKGYADIVEKSMDHQRHMFGLMIEVNLGHTVASNVTSTAKTLLTQSG